MRRAAIIDIDTRQRGFEALMHTMVTCGTLWSGFWFQFVIGFMYNSPAIHTLSRGNWFPPHVEFYLPVQSSLTIPLADSFAWLSVVGALLALLGVWHWTHGVRGRWKMRILVAGFAGFLSLWSLAALSAEDAAWQALEDRHARIEREIVQVRDAHGLGFLKREKEWVERRLEMRTKRQ